MSTQSPNHIAFIMDGNRRYAKIHHRPIQDILLQSVDVLENVLHVCQSLDISYVTIYAFSTENWQRSKSEVQVILALLGKYVDSLIARIEKQQIHIRFIGDLSVFSSTLQEKLQHLQQCSMKYTQYHLSVALNYGGQREILRAANSFIATHPGQSMTMDDFKSELYTYPDPYPDILVRTGGDLRISNFLLWQLAYTELFFLPIYWPELTAQDIQQVYREYTQRNRKYGK